MRIILALLLLSVALQPFITLAQANEENDPNKEAKKVLESAAVKQLDNLIYGIFKEYPVFAGANLENFKKYADEGKLEDAVGDLKTLAGVIRSALFEEKYGAALYDISKFTITKVFPTSKHLFTFSEGYAKAFEEINSNITGNNLAYIRNVYYRKYDNNCRQIAREKVAEGLRLGNSISQVTTLVEMKCEADNDKVKKEAIEYINGQGMFEFYGQGDIAAHGGGYICSGLGSWLKSTGRVTENLKPLIHSPNTAANECESAAKLFLLYDPAVKNYPKVTSHYFKYVSSAKPLFDKLKRAKAMAKAIREADQRYNQLKNKLLAEKEKENELKARMSEVRKSHPTVTVPVYDPPAGKAGEEYTAKVVAEDERIAKRYKEVTEKYQNKKKANLERLGELKKTLPKNWDFSRFGDLESAPAASEIDPLLFDYNQKQIDFMEPLIKYGSVKVEELQIQARILQDENERIREHMAITEASHKVPHYRGYKKERGNPIPGMQLTIEENALKIENLNNRIAAISQNIGAYSQRLTAYQQAIDEGTKKLEEMQTTKYQPAVEEYEKASREVEKTREEINELTQDKPLNVDEITREINNTQSAEDLAGLGPRLTEMLDRYDELSSQYENQMYRMESSSQQASSVLSSAESSGAKRSFTFTGGSGNAGFGGAGRIDQINTMSSRAFLAHMDLIVASNQRLKKDAVNLYREGEELVEGLAFLQDHEYKKRSSRLSQIVNIKPHLIKDEETIVNGKISKKRSQTISSGKKTTKQLKLENLLTLDTREALDRLSSLNNGLIEANKKHKELINKPVSFTIERLGSLTGESVSYVMGGRPFVPDEEDIEDGGVPLEILASGFGLLGPTIRLEISANGTYVPFDYEFNAMNEDLVEAVYTATLPIHGNGEQEIFIKAAVSGSSFSHYTFKLAPQSTDFAGLREKSQELLNSLQERYRGRDWWAMEELFHEDDYEGDLSELEEKVNREFDSGDSYRQLRFSLSDINHRDGTTVALVSWNKGTSHGNSQFHLRNNKIVEITGEMPFGGAKRENGGDSVDLRTYVASFTVGNGFDISGGRGVSNGSSSADFEFYGHGSGEIFSNRACLIESDDDFDDMDEAPSGGYDNIISLDDGIAFYVQTAEGHYAKALVNGSTLRVVYNPSGGRELK